MDETAELILEAYSPVVFLCIKEGGETIVTRQPDILLLFLGEVSYSIVVPF